MKPGLQLVASAARTGSWRIAADESVIELVVEGAVVCTIAPWTDNKTGELAWWGATAGDRQIGLDVRLAEVCRIAALDAGVSAPVPPELLASLRESADPADATPRVVASAAAPLLERFADLLAAILDEPLHTLSGPGPDGGHDPLQLRLAHFRPDLSERAAVLLEEAGR